MAVSIPGVILSSLMFDMKNSPGDKVGLLLGETLRYNVSAITDSECSGTREERRICIQEYVITETIYSFCDRKGIIDYNKLEELLNGRLKNIVGWYRYRCNSTHQLSLMEKLIQCSLMQGLPHASGKDLVFGLFTENTPDDAGLHTLDHSFSKWIGSSPQFVHVDVVNLKSTSTMPYRFSPIAPIPLSINSYHTLFNQDVRLIDNTTHSLAMDKLLEDLQRKFDPLQLELRQSHNTIQTLGEDILNIKRKINDLKTIKGKQIPLAANDLDVQPLISFNDDDESPSMGTDHHSNDNLANGVDCTKPATISTMATSIPDLITDIITDTNDDEDTISV